MNWPWWKYWWHAMIAVTCKVCLDHVKRHAIYCEGKLLYTSDKYEMLMFEHHTCIVACALICHDKCRQSASRCIPTHCPIAKVNCVCNVNLINFASKAYGFSPSQNVIRPDHLNIGASCKGCWRPVWKNLQHKFVLDHYKHRQHPMHSHKAHTYTLHWQG